MHALQHQYLTLDRVEWIVVDEADRLFENGFEHQVCARCIVPGDAERLEQTVPGKPIVTERVKRVMMCERSEMVEPPAAWIA